MGMLLRRHSYVGVAVDSDVAVGGDGVVGSSARVDFSTRSVDELKEIAKQKGLKGYSKLSKKELVELLDVE